MTRTLLYTCWHCPHSMRSRVCLTVRCPSACRSQHGPTSANQLLYVCCCWPGGQEISIDCCTVGAQQRRRVNAGSATLSVYVWSWTQICPTLNYLIRRPCPVAKLQTAHCLCKSIRVRPMVSRVSARVICRCGAVGPIGYSVKDVIDFLSLERR